MRAALLATACTICLVSFAFASQAEQPDAPALATAPAAASDPLLLQVPKTPEDVAARLQLARERLDALRPTTQPTTQAADETAARSLEARAALYREWEAYLAQVLRHLPLQERRAALSSEQHVQTLTDRVETLRQETADLNRLSPPVTATDEQLAEITARYEDMESQAGALSELQTQRAAQIATGFKQQREAAEVELQDLRRQRQELRASIRAGTTAAPAEQELLDLERMRLDVQIARTELALEALAVEADRTELMAKQDEQYLESLRPYVIALRQRMAALSEANSRTALDVIELKRKRAVRSHEIALLDLQYFGESVLLTYFRNQELVNARKDRFPSATLHRIRDRVTTSATTWDEMIASLHGRTGREAMSLRAEVRRDGAAYEAELAPLRAKLGESLSELHEVQTVRERALQRFGELSRQLTVELASADPVERARLETEATSLRSSLDEAMRTTMAEVQETVARLKEALALSAEHVSKLRQIENALYWTALLRRESGMAGLDWSSILKDVRQILGWQERDDTKVARRPAPTSVLAGLFVEEPDVRQDVESKFRLLADDFRAIEFRSRVLFGAVVVVVGGLAVLLRTYARRRAARLLPAFSTEAPAGVPHTAVQHLSERMNLLAWRFVASASIPVAVGVVCWVAAVSVDLARRSRSSVIVLLAFLLAASVAIALVRHLFAPAGPQQRVVPCGDAAASHYRKWLLSLLIFATVVLLLPLFFHMIDVAPGIRAALWESFKTGVLLMLLAFLLRKDRVMGIAGELRKHWIWTLASALYPLLFLGVLGLLVLQIVGYGVLVEFIGAGILQTLAILVLVGAAVEYICDLLDRYPGAAVASDGPGAAPSRMPASLRSAAKPAPAQADSASAEEDDAGQTTPLIRVAKVPLRLAAAGLAIALIVRVWGIPVLVMSPDWKVVGLGALAVVIALVVDRIVFTALHTLRVSGRVPPSTANIIRRWVRGLLAVVVLLCMVALAGYPIGELWTLLATLLAMVAIGFVAVWSVLCNVMSTLIILIWRPFNVGERIEIQPDGIAGEVVDINFMYTLLKSDSGERTTVPNSLFTQKFIKREKVRAKPQRSLAEQLEADKPLDE